MLLALGIGVLIVSAPYWMGRAFIISTNHAAEQGKLPLNADARRRTVALHTLRGMALYFIVVVLLLVYDVSVLLSDLLR
jgi:hypothetical protein